MPLPWRPLRILLVVNAFASSVTARNTVVVHRALSQGNEVEVVETNRRGTYLGEMAPLSNAPVTIFDENGNWKYTAHSDTNGNYEVLLPSMDTYNCPLPAGPASRSSVTRTWALAHLPALSRRLPSIS